MITLCKTCGTSYDATPARCPVCEDERQYVPASGQAWSDFATVTATHSNKWQQLEPQLLSIKTVPAFAINQRALLLRTPTAISFGIALRISTRQPEPSSRRSAASARSRFHILTTTPRCRSGPGLSMRRFTCTRTIASGLCATARCSTSGRAIRWTFSPR